MSMPLNRKARLKNLPVSFFSVVMGLTGAAIALQKAAEIKVVNEWISYAPLFVSTVVFVVLLAAYSAKIGLHFSAIKEEFEHPTKTNFMPTISISFILQAIAYHQVNHNVSLYLWIIGICVQFILSITIIGGWIWREKISVEHFSPVWFIPAVGNMLVPVAGVSFGLSDISWFFFSVGVLFWAVLTVVFFYRSFFHPQISSKLLPTFFILIAPPAVMTIALFKLTGEVSVVPKMSYYISLFLFMLLLSRINRFMKIPFFLSWWAYSFPIAALTIATGVMYRGTMLVGYLYFMIFLVATLSLLITFLIVKTITAIYQHKICTDD